MFDLRLPDCRPPQRNRSFTNASSHPELISGDLAMRPRIQVPLALVDPARSLRVIAMCALIAGAVAAYWMIYHYAGVATQGARTDRPALALACTQWHRAASNAVAGLLRSTSDIDLRQANDALFRLRRARRNCQEGWLTMACQDYSAIARTTHGRPGSDEETLLACRHAAGGVDEGFKLISAQQP